jgi:acyl-coenzyme A synthetase/AMP-(fatty) acid ligase
MVSLRRPRPHRRRGPLVYRRPGKGRHCSAVRQECTSEDIEAHYLKCPLVAELAIIGVEDETESRAGAEKLAAVVVPDFAYLKQAAVANSKEAIRHALDNLGRELPEYQRVRDYLIRIEPLPRTATNKIKRFQLKKEIETGEIAAETKPETSWKLSDEDRPCSIAI